MSTDDPFIAVEEGDQVEDEELLLDAFDDGAPAPRASYRSMGSGAPRPMRVSLFEEGDVVADRYRVERVLGRDGHEVVLFVRHLELGERALMRCLLPEASNVPDAFARFRRGAQRSLQHRSEHTERVLDFGGLPNGSAYKVVELPRGPSLEEILRVRGELPVEEAADTAITICEALAEIHAARNVFRNLSPANVYIERRQDGTPAARLVSSGGLEILDHGALRGDELAIFGTAASVASLAYAAPEQFRNPGGVDARADIWSLGALLYELLTGSPPFSAENSVVLISMIAADPVASPAAFRDDLSDELDDIVVRCLEKDPALRPQTMHELVELLLPFATEQVQTTADRVQRITLRSIRPSNLASQRNSLSAAASFAPASMPALPRNSIQPRSIPARTTRRPSYVASVSRSTPPDTSRKSIGIVILGASVGAIAALAATVLNRPASEAVTSTAMLTATSTDAAPAAPTASVVAVLTVPEPTALRPAPERPARPRVPKTERVEFEVERAGRAAGATVPSATAAATSTPVTETPATAQLKGESKTAPALFGGID